MSTGQKVALVVALGAIGLAAWYVWDRDRKDDAARAAEVEAAIAPVQESAAPRAIVAEPTETLSPGIAPEHGLALL